MNDNFLAHPGTRRRTGLTPSLKMASLFGIGLVGNYDYLSIICYYRQLNVHGRQVACIATVFKYVAPLDIFIWTYVAPVVDVYVHCLRFGYEYSAITGRRMDKPNGVRTVTWRTNYAYNIPCVNPYRG